MELVPPIEWNEAEVVLKLGRWNWSATNRVSMSLLFKPVRVDDEKEKEEFEGVAMLHVSKQTFSSDASDFATGTLRIH